jgi:16S rRNA (cytosine967-C5)-methyltransferase
MSLTLAEHIIRRADASHPADALLRQELKAQRGLNPPDAREVSYAVFAYYRWRGWLNPDRPFPQQLARAVGLARQFAHVPETIPDAELVARSLPPWTSEEVEVTPAWARALQTEPILWLRARPGKGGELSRKLEDCQSFGSGPLGDAVRYDGDEDLFRTPLFHGGEFEVQDLSSQAVGLACGPKRGETWWDACAGEGGKMLHLSDLMANTGLIWASDRAAWRLQKLKRRAARAKAFNYRSVPWDGGSRLPTKTRFDGVLLDAPCSGLGTWHRNPHARWTTTRQDVEELAALQGQLLKHAAQAVKPGGRLIYAVCTVTRSETTRVAEAFPSQVQGFTPLPFPHPLDPARPAQASCLIWPQEFGGNGMFIAAWVRA